MKDPIHFKVEIKAKNKHQLERLIKKLVKREFDFSFTPNHHGPYIVTVESIWGGNLEWIGKIAAQADDSGLDCFPSVDD